MINIICGHAWDSDAADCVVQRQKFLTVSGYPELKSKQLVAFDFGELFSVCRQRILPNQQFRFCG